LSREDRLVVAPKHHRPLFPGMVLVGYPLYLVTFLRVPDSVAVRPDLTRPHGICGLGTRTPPQPKTSSRYLRYSSGVILWRRCSRIRSVILNAWSSLPLRLDGRLALSSRTRRIKSRSRVRRSSSIPLKLPVSAFL